MPLKSIRTFSDDSRQWGSFVNPVFLLPGHHRSLSRLIGYIKCICFCFFFFFNAAFAQEITIKGEIKDENNQPIKSVNVFIHQLNEGTATDDNGTFKLQVPAHRSLEITFSHIQYIDVKERYDLNEGQSELEIRLVLETDLLHLKGVEVLEEGEDISIREQISITTIKPKSAKELPSPFGEFTKVLATLPGVVSNNELSSSYSVRGGNFDENLVYVNDIRVYRPFLIRSGQQEGLSFVNPDMVESIEFSAGGWQPKYGDKLSSTLNIAYKKPSKLSGSATLGLLGGALHVEGVNKKGTLGIIFGARHKSSQYLLNTLETKGGYRPSFTDIQSYINADLSREKDNSTTLGLLFSYARNRYQVNPETRETTFGAFTDTPESFRLLVAFDGRETLRYDIWQGGLKLKHQFKSNLTSNIILSGMYSTEREYFDIEGGYRLCDVNNNPATANFNECAAIRGIGTNYDYGRNRLQAQILNMEVKNFYKPHPNHNIEFGAGYSLQDIEDQVDEYSFTDSADFVTIDHLLDTDLDLKTNIYTGYLQHTFFIDPIQTLTYGARLNYRDVNDEILISPRMQYSIRPPWRRDILFKAAVGLYQQPPFYRELRGFDGMLNRQLKAQRSTHLILGMDYNFKSWGRNFKFYAETYYKKLSNVIVYDLDNVKVRYYANNRARAFATGIDLRVSGEFVPGTESWFSLSFLNTKEDLFDDSAGYVRRPSDQHINLGIFFQDHIPNDPSLRVNLSVLFGSGLPFGPPNDIDTRNIFTGSSYRRVDIGFSKVIPIGKDKHINDQYTRSVWIGLDILNLLGTNNTISYTWIKDFSGIEYAVPNNLSQRFFNLKVLGKF